MSLDYEVYVGPYFEVTPTAGAPSWGDVAQQISDTLFCHLARDRWQFWTPNAHRDQPRAFSFDPKLSDVFWPLDWLSPAEERGWLMRAFAAELDALRAAYGPANVRVRWGVLNMIS
jgi:hypothetical protein